MAVKQSASPIASYGYDALGRKSYRTSGGTTTRFSYNGRQILAEYDGSDTLLRKFIDGPGIDEPICMLMYNAQGTETGRVFYHFDALGSVIALSQYNIGNGFASIVEQYAYSAFGQTTILAPNSELRTASLFGNPYMFTGRRLDVETRSGAFSGLYDYRARIYSPDLGRFLQPDPIGYADGMNMYAYCGNNPVNWIDPLGLAKIVTRPMGGKLAPWVGKHFRGDTPYAHHWQIVYDDNTNIGFFDDGEIRSDTNTNYTKTMLDNLDDATLHVAVEIVNAKWDHKYSIKENNCQDYARSVIYEYGRLRREKIQKNPQLNIISNEKIKK